MPKVFCDLLYNDVNIISIGFYTVVVNISLRFISLYAYVLLFYLCLCANKSSSSNNITIFFAKKDLKGSKIAITEHLTQNTQERLAEVKKLFGKNNVWTSQVKVKARVNHQRFVIPTIAYAYELKDWADKRATEPFAHPNGNVYAADDDGL